MKKGDKFTISGVRYGSQFKHGFTMRCKPGNETVFTSKGNEKNLRNKQM